MRKIIIQTLIAAGAFITMTLGMLGITPYGISLFISYMLFAALSITTCIDCKSFVMYSLNMINASSITTCIECKMSINKSSFNHSLIVGIIDVFIAFSFLLFEGNVITVILMIASICISTRSLLRK